MADTFLQRINEMIMQPKSHSQYIASLSPDKQREGALESLGTVADFTPVVGESKALYEAEQAREQGDYLTAGLGYAGAIPLAGMAIRPVTGMLRSAGNLINKTLQNTPTHIPEFYSNPLKGGFNFAKEATSAIVPAIKESISPQGVANRRVLGISDRKVSDWASDVGQDADLTAISISRQLPNTEDTLLERSVVGLKYLDSRIPREDTTRLASGIGGGFRAKGEIPDSIINRALNHLTQGPHITNPNARYEYQIKDPSAGKNAGYIEAVGAAGAGAPVVRAMRGQTTDKYLTVVNNLNKAAGKKPVDKLAGKEMIEYLQVASTLDGSAFRLMNKMGAGDQPSVMLETLLRARAKQNAGRKLQVGEQKVLSSFNRLLDTKAIKMARVSDEAGNVVGGRNLTDIREPDGYLVTQQSYTSRQQELGGMNAFVVVDPNKEKMYTMLSDGHDMYGLNPVGGHGLITASPLIESSYKTGSLYNNEQIKKKATPAKIKKALKDTEQTTGVRKLAKETPEAYTKRALLQAKPPVTEADIARAASARNKLVGTAAAGTGIGVGMLTGGNQEQ